MERNTHILIRIFAGECDPPGLAGRLPVVTPCTKTTQPPERLAQRDGRRGGVRHHRKIEVGRARYVPVTTQDGADQTSEIGSAGLP